MAQKKELDRFDTTAKRDMQIQTKLITSMLASIVGCVAGTLILTLIIFNRGLVQDTENGMNYTASAVQSMMNEWNKSLQSYSQIIAGDDGIKTAVIEQDPSLLFKELMDIEKAIDVDFLAIIDRSGRVVTNGAKNVTAGSDVSSSSAVRTALQGYVASDFNSFSTYNYAMIGSAPIKHNGSTIGCVVTGFDMTKDTFPLLVKSGFNVECTIIKGDTRVATTLGRDLVGVKVSDQNVLSTVLTNKATFHGRTTINGKRYYAIYMPIIANNAVTGMTFAAKSMEVIQSTRNHTITIVVPIIIIVASLISIAVYRFIHWLMWRIYNVTNFLKEMETGDADLTKRCKLFIRDEIGDLIIHFDLFLDKLQDIIKQLKESKTKLSSSGNDMAASSEDASSSITQIITNISGISDQITGQSTSVHQTADAVDDIAKSITQLDDMIESQSAGVSEASSAVGQMMSNIASVNTSVEKMSESFETLSENARTGFSKQEAVNERIKQIENQSAMLQEANQAILNIASQTNLLAMNAAIEAAHAGEAGKGFSVVADEIRKLSETSSAQSKTIGEQLNKIKEAITEVVSASMESSAAFSAVSRQIQETDQIVLQIRSAMEEQNSGSRQINDALKEMNESTGEVQKASKDMANKNMLILKEMGLLRNSTNAMKQSMDEMAVGARKVGESGTVLTEISGSVRDAIEKIGAQIDLFKV
ncbi:MAG: cache domain-containing protein [Treponema sp.]|nr:cache domain-containing protein [Treponema sp.]